MKMPYRVLIMGMDIEQMEKALDLHDPEQVRLYNSRKEFTCFFCKRKVFITEKSIALRERETRSGHTVEIACSFCSAVENLKAEMMKDSATVMGVTERIKQLDEEESNGK
jgi:hypothetical protein